MRRQRLALAAITACATAFLAIVSSAAAVTSRTWELDALSNTTAQPGSTFQYYLEAENMTGASTDGSPVTARASLPQGFVPTSATWSNASTSSKSSCTITGQTVECTAAETLEYGLEVAISTSVEPGLEGNRTTYFKVEGGGIPPATTADPTRIRDVPPPFGIAAFDVGWSDGAGHPDFQAGSHPADFSPFFDFNTATDPAPTGGPGTAIEPTKDTFVALPPGFIGNPTHVAKCTQTELVGAEGGSDIFPAPLCPPDSQIGTVFIRNNAEPRQYIPHDLGPFPIYNMVPPPGVAARFGFNVLKTIIVIDTSVRSGGDYGLTSGSRSIPEAVGLTGLKFDFWGVPSSPSHDAMRSCPGLGNLPPNGATCTNEAPETAFFRTPTSCNEPGVGVTSTIQADSYTHPGVFKEAASVSHLDPGYPYAPGEWGEPQGFEGCEEEPFEPSLNGAPPAGAEAGEPTSFSFDLSMPQKGLLEPGAISESDLRKVTVTLPEGVRVNPSSADGLGSCSPEQVGLTTAVGDEHPHFTNDAGNCPESAKIGQLEITTPLLDHKIAGAVYLAEPQQNPFGSMIALYLIAHDPVSGVNLKLAGKVGLDPSTGQITTTFDDNPQLPFENLHLELKSGPRAALSAPSACGTYTTRSSFVGWNGATVQGSSSFTVEHGCLPSGFSPALHAGTRNANAGSFSPFSLRLTRTDSDQEFASISTTLPPGLSARLAGVPYCPETAIVAATALSGYGEGAGALASPTCPAASQIGTVTAGAGAGITPFFLTTGRAYLAGPYQGAPLSLFTEVPAVAGPFDLGVVTNRVALHLNPETAQITADSEPLPTSLFGIPLQLRDLRVEVNRENFALNPTDCEPMTTDATVRSVQGQTASLNDRFQVANCDLLPFKPKLSLRLNGNTNRGAHPAFTATLTMPPGNANIARAQVTLPHSAFLDQGHITGVCTHVQFEGSGCPPGSALGFARAETPLLDHPLEGPVYLMSGFGHKLPDLAADLNGQIRVLLHGKVDTGKGGGIRNTFEVVPDAPVTRFTLSLQGGRRGLIQNSEDLCSQPQRFFADFTAQNGKVAEFSPALKVSCGAQHYKKHKRGR